MNTPSPLDEEGIWRCYAILSSRMVRCWEEKRMGMDGKKSRWREGGEGKRQKERETWKERRQRICTANPRRIEKLAEQVYL